MRNEAFDMVKDDYQRHDQSMIIGRFERTHRDRDLKEIREEIEAAYDLAEACYGFGEIIRQRRKSKESALEEMKEKFPGFADTTYQNALNHGLFVSR